MKKTIRQLSINYVAQWMVISIIMYLIAHFGAQQFGYAEIVEKPLYLSLGFTIATAALVSVLWRWISENNEEMLTTFYSATSAFRMLLALFTLTICFFIVGSEAITPYVVVFMIFYIVSIGHHAIFFAHITNKK